MTPLFKVIAPGLHTTVQDLGRRGAQDIGVPVAGVLDRVAFRLANGLVGNGPNVAALEILLQGPTLEVAADALRVALVGGGGELELGDGRKVPAGRSVRLEHGSTVRVGGLGEVSCAVLAVEGGIAVPGFLGSASTYARGGLGGFHGRRLAAGDLLPGNRPDVDVRDEVELATPFEGDLAAPIRVVLGPQDDYFAPDAVAALLGGEYTISPDADRMGFRLDGPALAHSRGYDIVSDAIVAGSIQVPGSGQPIVLLVDAQTAGGYPKIATVVSADIPVLGRRRPGAKVRFAAVSQAQAEAIRREQEASLARAIEGFRTVRHEGEIDLAALYEANLIGGMVDASRA